MHMAYRKDINKQRLSKDIIYVKEKNKRYNIIGRFLTSIVLQSKTEEHDPNWSEIPDHPYRIVIVPLEQQMHYLI